MSNYDQSEKLLDYAFDVEIFFYLDSTRMATAARTASTLAPKMVDFPLTAGDPFSMPQGYSTEYYFHEQNQCSQV